MTVTEQATHVRAGARPRGWKAILVHVESGGAAALRLKAALALAKRFDAHLIGIGAQCVDPTTLSFGPGAGETWADLQAQCRDELAQAAREFANAVRTTSSSEFRMVEEKPATAMARASRAAGVIVSGGAPPDRHDSYRTASPAELAIASGRPVLVAPAADRPLVAENVVVAWKETREARRALADALPLLRAAKNVTVVEVCEFLDDSKAEFRTQDVAAALRREGVRADARTVRGDEGQVASMLIAEANARGADLIVAGCYGRTRIGEWVFGGVSRDLLRAPDRYLLISH